MGYDRTDAGSLYDTFHTHLHRDWKAEDEGDLTDILGIAVTKEGSEIVLKQTEYIDKMVETYLTPADLLRHTAKQPPYTTKFKESLDAALDESNVAGANPELTKKFHSIVGALMYAATVSRPNIAFTVNTLCKVMSRPTPEIYAEAVACLVYLHHHRDLGLRYSSDASILSAYSVSDSDWATDKSTTGIFLSCGTTASSIGRRCSNRRPLSLPAKPS